MRNGTIEIRLPYPVRLGFVSFFIKRNIGFSFDQLSMFRLLQNNEIDLPTHSDWLKKTPKSVIASEQIFAAAESYCISRRKKNNFTKEGLAKALNEAGEKVTKRIIDCYMQSEQLGQRKMPGRGKKKASR